MSIIKCPSCGQLISDHAPGCPCCGMPLSAPRNPTYGDYKARHAPRRTKKRRNAKKENDGFASKLKGILVASACCVLGPPLIASALLGRKKEKEAEYVPQKAAQAIEVYQESEPEESAIPLSPYESETIEIAADDTEPTEPPVEPADEESEIETIVAAETSLPPESETPQAEIADAETAQSVNAAETETIEGAAPARVDIGEIMVWVSDDGFKYHSKDTCSNMTENVRQVTINEAKEMGRSACHRCYPPE